MGRLMIVLKLGLYLAVVGWGWVSWASWSAGYPPEVALLRGMVAFGAVSLLAYAGELIVATAPPARAKPNLDVGRPDQRAADDPGGDDVPDELPRAA